MEQYNTYNGKAYRFVSIEALKKTVTTKSLRFIRPDQFNDPLDCSPLITPHPWKVWKVAGTEFMEYVKSKTFEGVFESMYVCSFSKTYKSERSYLMWAYYAKQHTQVCFELDFESNPYLGNPSNVNYPKSLANARNNLVGEKDTGLFIMTTKLNVWKHEDEVRLIVDTLNPNFYKLNAKRCSENKYLYVPFNPGTITKIIFGVNCSEENQSEIINLMEGYNYSPLYEKMFIDPETLSLNSKPILNKTT